MPISGLVVTLDPDVSLAADGMAELERDGRIDVGVRSGSRVAVVSTTADDTEDRGLWQALRACPGIRHVDVVFIDFDREAERGDAE